MLIPFASQCLPSLKAGDCNRHASSKIDSLSPNYDHVTSVCSQVNSKSHLLRRNSYLFPLSFRITLVKLFILSRFNYCSSLFFHEASTVDKTSLNICYSRSIKKMIGINISTLNVDQQTSVLKEFSLLPLEINYFKCSFMVRLVL